MDIFVLSAKRIKCDAASQRSALAPGKWDSEALKFRRAAEHLLDGGEYPAKYDGRSNSNNRKSTR